MTIGIDQAKTLAANWLENHAADFGRYLVNATVAWVRDRRGAEDAIRRARVEYESAFDSLETAMRVATETPIDEKKP